MSHHKRRRPKHQRSGCLHCKPYKDERVKSTVGAQTKQELRARVSEQEQLKDS